MYKDGYFEGYDPTINPAAAAGFTTAAFRFGHSLLPSLVGKLTFVEVVSDLLSKELYLKPLSDQ